MFDFFIEGNPVPQGRPRFTGKHAYTPAKSRAWSKYVKQQIMVIKAREKWTMIEKGIPLRASFTFILPSPKSSELEYHTTKPDLDNLIKPIKDSMSGLLYHDDCQIVGYGRVNKRYAEEGEDTGVYVRIDKES